MRRAVATLPVAEADFALTGRRVSWFQEWIRHGPDEPYWQDSDHRQNVVQMPPVVYLQAAGTTSSSPDARRLRRTAGSRSHCSVADRALGARARSVHPSRDT